MKDLTVDSDASVSSEYQLKSLGPSMKVIRNSFIQLLHHIPVSCIVPVSLFIVSPVFRFNFPCACIPPSFFLLFDELKNNEQRIRPTALSSCDAFSRAFLSDS